MTPKEKAEELVLKMLRVKDWYNKDGWLHKQLAKQFAIIAVDEIIEFGNQSGIREPMMYWNKVKQEIEKL